MNEQISRLIEIKRLERKNKTDRKIISVCSGKGGTGKSFLALNFGYKLSRLNKKVLVVDFDLNFSNLHLMINEISENPISNLFLQKSSLDELIFKYTENLHFIFGDSGSSEFPKLNNDLLEYFFIHLDYISNEYDYIILDSSAGADDLVIYQLSRSDINFIVASPEPTAVMDAYVLIKVITENLEQPRNFVVINKADNKEEGEQAFKNLNTAVNHFLKTEIILLGVIDYDRLVYKSIVNQELFTAAYPNSVASLEIEDIVHRFLKIEHVANNNQPYSSNHL
ncbi:AAA family ATPase [Ignavibacteria bacterium 4148-Me]|uniref:AAA family ATPase n=1 Tax=Rosettibacter primus TaxID=3111523 RepID=UPI00336BDBC8